VQFNRDHFDALKERLRDHLPCFERDFKDNKIETTVPLVPKDIAIADQAKQKTFLQRDITRYYYNYYLLLSIILTTTFKSSYQRKQALRKG